MTNVNSIDFYAAFIVILLVITLLLTCQSLFTLIWMLYAWENPENVQKQKSPSKFAKPNISFTLLVPARHEEKVIKDTLESLSDINYPNNLIEILVLCRYDDEDTINVVNRYLLQTNKNYIKLIIVNGYPINKPNALNQGLQFATKQVVGIFDAEDEPNPDILNIINTVFLEDSVDIVQSGVQLMNYKSRWFSKHNVLEYYFWFKSGLHFFTNIGHVSPLGGNTVFLKRKWLEKIGGWDNNCLTEDADIGIRLTLAGAKTKIIYDEQHSTQEETPDSLIGLIKQRTRWNQGFLQILFKGDWKKLPTLRQQFMASYVMISPILQALLFIYMPVGIYLALTQKLPVWLSLISFTPLYLLILQLITDIIGLFMFLKDYKMKSSIVSPFLILLTFYPYQIALIYSAFRAVTRFAINRNIWEKTFHANNHRINNHYFLNKNYV